MSLDIHKDIKKRLNNFVRDKDIPNIIFHGPSGNGKHTIVYDFINEIYGNDKTVVNSYVLNVNCAHGKGIRFIREDLKFFAKTHINIHKGKLFKSIVLSNADKLTIDGQSALRRSIELFNHNTRFFIIVEDKYKLLMPILSRFCEIYLPLPMINNKQQNLHQYKILMEVPELNNKNRQIWLKKTLTNAPKKDYKDLVKLSIKLYDKSYSGLDLLNYIEHTYISNTYDRYKLLVVLHKIKREYRNEKLFMLFILNYMFLRSDIDLENITFM
jgi:hypothetical protein